MIDHNEIATEKAGKYPLDMSQYKKIFGTCRIPAPQVDKIEYNPRSRHIVVIFKNGVSIALSKWQLFWFLYAEILFLSLYRLVLQSARLRGIIGEILNRESADRAATAHSEG